MSTLAQLVFSTSSDTMAVIDVANGALAAIEELAHGPKPAPQRRYHLRLLLGALAKSGLELIMDDDNGLAVLRGQLTDLTMDKYGRFSQVGQALMEQLVFLKEEEPFALIIDTDKVLAWSKAEYLAGNFMWWHELLILGNSFSVVRL